jgi:hypothetical protein
VRNETEMKVMWDLCSGLGGASEAFVRDGGWKVIRIENNPMLSGVEDTLMLDILEWRGWVDELILEHGVPDFIWASPPCTEFSRAFSAPAPTAQRRGEEFEPCLDLVYAIQDLLYRVRPRYFVVENVRGAIPYFDDIFGPYSQRIESFYLWGRFPALWMEPSFSHSKYENDTWSDDPLRANKRGYVPIEISRAVLKSVETQTTLMDWV